MAQFLNIYSYTMNSENKIEGRTARSLRTWLRKALLANDEMTRDRSVVTALDSDAQFEQHEKVNNICEDDGIVQ